MNKYEVQITPPTRTVDGIERRQYLCGNRRAVVRKFRRKDWRVNFYIDDNHIEETCEISKKIAIEKARTFVKRARFNTTNKG